jgi:hypothetical protein
VFQGLPPERIQEVLDQTRAAGVTGSIHFSLNFFDAHEQRESFATAVDHRLAENADVSDALLISDISDAQESHDVGEQFAIGAVFDVATFDRNFALV